MTTLYWHNIWNTNDATDRTNYTTDSAGLSIAPSGSPDSLRNYLLTRIPNTGNSLRGYFPLHLNDDVSGDISLLNFDGTLIGTEGIDYELGNRIVTDVPLTNVPENNASLSFLGAAGYMDLAALAANAFTGQLDVTINLGANLNSIPPGGEVATLLHLGNDGADELHLYVNQTGSLRLFHANATDSQLTTTPDNIILAGTKYYISLRIQAGLNYSLYVNGAIVGSSASGLGAISLGAFSGGSLGGARAAINPSIDGTTTVAQASTQLDGKLQSVSFYWGWLNDSVLSFLHNTALNAQPYLVPAYRYFRMRVRNSGAAPAELDTAGCNFIVLYTTPDVITPFEYVGALTTIPNDGQIYTLEIDAGSVEQITNYNIGWLTEAPDYQILEGSLDGVSWEFIHGVNNPVVSCFSHTFSPLLLDDIRFDGTGTGGDDDWTIPSMGSLSCNSIYAGGINYSGTWYIDATAALTVTEDIDYLWAGTFTELRGTITCRSLLRIQKHIGSTAGRFTLQLTDADSIIGYTSQSGGAFVLAANVIALDGAFTIDTPGGRAISDSTHSLNGTITGAPAITKTGEGSYTLTLLASGRTSEVDSVTILEGGIFIYDAANSGSVIQGIGGAGGEPSTCPITLGGDDTVLRYGCANNGDVEWGNPLLVAGGITGAALLFQGVGNSATHYCYFPITMDSDLRLYRGANASSVVSLCGTVGWTGTGTVDSDAGKITGTGKLTVERPWGLNVSLGFLLMYASGARAEHTGGTRITSPTQSYSASCGYQGLTGEISVEFGTGLIEVNGNAKFWPAGSTSETRTILNDILLSGAFTGDTTIPELKLEWSAGSNPTTIFSGMITVDCPAFLVHTGSGGANQQHLFTGGVTLLQDTRCVFFGANGQDLVFASDIAGAFILSLKALNSGGDIKFSFAQSIPRAYTAEAGNGRSIFIEGLTALKTATSVEVLDGATLRYEIEGETELDGQLLMRVGSKLEFTTPNRFLRLNGIGPHELSGELEGPTQARSTEIIIPTDGTVVEFNAPSPLSMPIFRITGDVVFQTANVTNTVIRPGQDTTASLPAGASVMFLERGKTLTVNSNLQLSMNQGNLEATGVAGIATIEGTGILSFVQADNWIMPPYSNIVFDIRALFSGTVPALTRLFINGQTFLKDMFVQNNNVNLTVTFTDVTVGGDFYAQTNTAGGSGNIIVKWAGTNEVSGDYYQLYEAAGTGAHRTEILDDCVMRVSGDWRPASNKVEGPGDGSSYSMRVYAGERWELTIGGDWRTRINNFYNFEPLNPATFNEIGKIIFDLTNNVDGLDINNEYYATVADVEFINTSGAPRTATVSLGSWWFNSILVSGDNITLDMSQGGGEAYFGSLNCTGLNCSLNLPDYLETHTFAWLHTNLVADFTFDLRGFATVDTSAITVFGAYPDGVADYWFNGADFSQGLTALRTNNYDLAGGGINFRDDFTIYNLHTSFGNSVNTVYGTISVVNDFKTLGSRGTNTPGQVWQIEEGASVKVNGSVDLREAGSPNTSYDVKVTTPGTGELIFEPVAGLSVRQLDLANTADPLVGVLNLRVLGKDGEVPGDASSYVVSVENYGGGVHLGNLYLDQPSTTAGLTFLLSSGVELENLTTTISGSEALTLDFNNKVLICNANFSAVPATAINKGGADARLEFLVVGSFEHSFPTAQLPHLDFYEGAHLFLTDVDTELLHIIGGGTSMDLNGRTITADNAILEAPANFVLAGLAGSTWNIAEGWSASGIDLQAPSTWYLNVGGSGAASLVNVSNSDASGGSEIQAINSVDSGANINWDFGFSTFNDTGVEIGNNLGLGLTFIHA